jgi:hypothetical protein
MTLQLNLPPQLEQRLRLEAERQGLAPDAVTLQILDQHLPQPLDDQRAAAIAMLHQGMEEDANANGDPEEAEQFFRDLDAARASNRPLFPPEKKGISW